MMSAGIQPISAQSILTGASKKIYDNFISSGFSKGENNIVTRIGEDVFTERNEDRDMRILSDKRLAWSTAKAMIDETTINGVVSINGGQNVTTFLAGVGTSGDNLVAGTYPAVGNINTPSLNTLKGGIS